MGEWIETTLGDLVGLQRGHDLPKGRRRPGTVPVVGSGGLAGFHDTAIVAGPGITIGRAANLGVPVLIDEDFWPLNTTLYVTDFKGNDVRFVYYLFQALDLAGYNSGSVQPMLNRNYIRGVHVRVPGLREQKEIAAVLGGLEDKIDANDRLIEVAVELAGTIYRQAVDGGTKTAAIGAIAELFDGPHATPAKIESGPWFLSISSLKSGRLVLAESAHLSEDDFAKWTRRATPRSGDILFSYETRLGEAALMPSGVRACLGRRMAMLRPRPGRIGSSVLFQAFRSHLFQEEIRQRAIHGATVDRIPLNDFPAWLIALPVHGVDRLESRLRSLDQAIANYARESMLLSELRDTLLPELMSGQLRIKDAEKIVEDST